MVGSGLLMRIFSPFTEEKLFCATQKTTLWNVAALTAEQPDAD